MSSRVKVLALVLLLSVVAVGHLVSGGAAAPPHGVTRAAAPQSFPTPPSKITSALAAIPVDVTGIPEQGNFDLYSWLTFVALNWPADTARCTADTTKSIIGGTGPTVWETYLTDADIFVNPKTNRPSPWCPPQAASARAAVLARLPQAVRADVRRSGALKVFQRFSKASPELKRRPKALRSPAGGGADNFHTIDEAVGGVLTDQNGRFVRYEVRVNLDQYNYITRNNLWNAAGQDNFTLNLKKTISFPVGTSPYGQTGSIEIKAAWKVLSDAEVAGGRFYTTTGYVFNDENGGKSPGRNPVTLGLVGLHIAHKTPKQHQWIWSTFEHVDNLTPAPGATKASFNDPNCPAPCPTNAQTAPTPYTELGTNGQPLNRPVQVTRVNPVGDASADQLNQTFQRLLQGSVWANYQLVSTQWTGELGTLPKPAFLANTVIETFNQTPSPPSDGPVPYPQPGYQPFDAGVATSSCLKRHSLAQTASALKKGQTQPKTDFSMIMGNAQ
jgi:hypothetical protein